MPNHPDRPARRLPAAGLAGLALALLLVNPFASGCVADASQGASAAAARGAARVNAAVWSACAALTDPARLLGAFGAPALEGGDR